MNRTILTFDPQSGSRGLIVEVHAGVKGATPTMLRELEGRMFDRSIRIGLLVTPRQTIVVRDTLSSLSRSKNSFERVELDTEVLLNEAGLHPGRVSRFYERVRTWLEVVAASWNTALPDEAFPAMVPDVVGHLVGAQFEEWDGLLDPMDALAS